MPTIVAYNPLASRVTPDGRHLLFESLSGEGLTGYDQTCGGPGCEELYVYSAEGHQLACVSCNPSGAPATVSATDMARTPGATGPLGTRHVDRVISADGSRVFFSTAEALVPQDTNGRVDAYEYDVPSGTVHLLSSGTSTSDSFFVEASADGSDAFFATRERLVGWDVDSSYDLYDARVGGGLPEPVAPPPGCVGDVCQGALGGAPGLPAVGSAVGEGAGNLPPAPVVAAPVAPRRRVVRCGRGFVRRRVHGRTRCVKRPGKATSRRRGR